MVLVQPPFPIQLLGGVSAAPFYQMGYLVNMVVIVALPAYVTRGDWYANRRRGILRLVCAFTVCWCVTRNEENELHDMVPDCIATTHVPGCERMVTNHCG